MPHFSAMLRTGLLCALLFAAGCNVFEGAYEEGESLDPRLLLEDADVALQRGDPQRAVVYLEKALAQVPEPGRLRHTVQIKLATSLLMAHDVDVRTLQRLAVDLQARVDAAKQGAARKGQTAVCNFPDTHTRGEEITLANVDGYAEINASEEALARIRALVDEVMAYAGPAQSGRYDIDARMAQLRAEGLSDALIADALAAGAVAYLGTTYQKLAQAGGEQIHWYAVTPPGGQPYVGYCAPSEALVQELLEVVACDLGNGNFAVALLEARATLPQFTDGAIAAEVAREAREAYELLVTAMTVGCPTTG